MDLEKKTVEQPAGQVDKKPVVKVVAESRSKKVSVRRTIRKMSMAAMFVALSFILSLLTYGLPKMPQGGSFSIEGLGIVISGLYLGPVYGFAVGACYSLVNLLMDGVIYHWASVFLDYVIPFGFIGFIGGVFSNFYYKNKIWSFFIATILGYLGRYLSSSLSGVLLFPTYAGDMGPVYYSFIFYNLPYIAASMGLVLAIGGVLYIPLQRLTRQVSQIISL